MHSKYKPPQWSRLTDDSLHEPYSSIDLVEAFNQRDLAAVQQVLEQTPQAVHDTAFFCNIKPRDGYGGHLPGMSAAEAAVHMAWAKVLPILHAAGDRFDKPRDIGALAMATQHQKSACVNTLIKLGAGIGKEHGGLAPIARLKPRRRLFEQNKAMRTIGKAYIRAGQDPWAETGRGIAVHCLLKNNALGVALDLLAGQIKQGKTAPPEHDPKAFWAAMVAGSKHVFTHDASLQQVLSHERPWCELVGLAKQAGICPDNKVVAEFLRTAVDRVQSVGRSSHKRAFMMMAPSQVAMTMADTMAGDERKKALDVILCTLEPHEDMVSGAFLALCRQELLEGHTPTAAAAIPKRAGARF